MENNKVVLPLLGALLAAVIGGAIWAIIAITTNYELGIIAWAIGGLAGYAVAILAGRRTNAVHQVIAVIASLLGILLGKYFIFGYYVNGESLSGMFDSEVFTLFQEVFTEMFQAVDIVFVVFAVATAWQLPKKLSDKAVQQEQPVSPQ